MSLLNHPRYPDPDGRPVRDGDIVEVVAGSHFGRRGTVIDATSLGGPLIQWKGQKVERAGYVSADCLEYLGRSWRGL